MMRSQLIQRIGTLARIFRTANPHVFTVLNVLVASLLLNKEGKYAEAAQSWIRFETTREEMDGDFERRSVQKPQAPMGDPPAAPQRGFGPEE
jgi:hypothetical protein